MWDKVLRKGMASGLCLWERNPGKKHNAGEAESYKWLSVELL